MKALRVFTSELIIWNARFGGKFYAMNSHATNNSTKTKYHKNIIYKFVKVYKHCRFPRMQNVFIHVITQENKLTLFNNQ